MFPVVPDRALLELARTEGGPDTLALLARDQDTRRLLLLRAVLDAAEAADRSVCTAAQKARLRADWALLTEADRAVAPSAWRPPRHRADPTTAGAGEAATRAGSDGLAPAVGPGGPATPAGPGDPAPPVGPGAPAPPAGADDVTPPWLPAPAAAEAWASPARARVFHPLTGPWARSCLRGLDSGPGAAGEERSRRLRRDLAHFSAIAAVAAAGAGIPFTTRLTARAGILALPSLGALHTARSGDVPVDVSCAGGRLVLRQPDAPDVTVHLESGVGAWSGALAWTPAHALPGLTPTAPPLPFDDLDPYRELPDGPRHGDLRTPFALDDAERKRWLQAWSGTAPVLRSGGARRLAEAGALLRCLVPLETPPDVGTGRGSCSATRREAFGALLSSTPPDPVTFAATLVHELQHAKLAALGDLVTLHRAGPEARYFAPWRADPRPYDGLLQGAYSHLAMADFYQRRALVPGLPDRDWSWAQHARYRAQVRAALPALVGSPDLTVRGRRFVDEMAAAHERMAEHPAPRGHVARAQAYVESARALWTRRHASALPPPNE
ncbi:aKG-HExxH-type peptide beta-hydroxylase [Streptomyces olivaceus]|uniref:aKG-HExxH-type peptide beta-hydroxylase n=1 Tax=Streptomyces olivaceus TaxID=47716 RepID=UPI001CCA04FE|nr:HEXXH motif-containing putative peptide modification protein [Streptomyces olivaceus]MBZ6285583.1 HEXXH motif domain-containing protein [Streptomyces olivaceus]